MLGGNALSKKTERASKEKYFQIIDTLLPILKTNLKVNMNSIVSYKNKDSFGDLDILIEKTQGSANLASTIQTLFPESEVVSNSGHSVSFDYDNLQIDLILVSKSNMDSALFYYSYNDLGNLLGRYYHKLGLKFGWDGLSYIVREEDKVFNEFIVSKDPEKILNLIGLSYDKYLEGFDNVEDIFEFVISSKYFRKDLFEYQNTVSRKRANKRKNFSGFVEYIKNKPDKYLEKFDYDKTKYISIIEQCFPDVNFKEKVTEIFEDREIARFRKQFLNGRIVMEKTGLKGIELGELMTKINNGNYIENITRDKSDDENTSYVNGLIYSLLNEQTK